MSRPLLNVEDLSVIFRLQGRKFRALRSISFSLQPGEILGVVGESGCGKSVMAKAIIRLLPEHSSSIERGRILYRGCDLTSFSEKQMREIRGKEISMIFQDPMSSLNPTLCIGEQIIEGYRLHHPHVTRQQAEAHAIELLKRVGVAHPRERMNAYPHMLSGGLRQRVMIAVAIACEPKILLADEPTTALDVTIQAQILDLLKNIAKEQGISIVLITHDLSVVAGLCDRILVMYAGKIVEEALVDKLFRAPHHPYTQRLLQSIPRIDTPRDSPLSPIPGRPPALDAVPTGCAFCVRCVHAMQICQCEEPIPAKIEEGHISSCWLAHKNAFVRRS